MKTYSFYKIGDPQKLGSISFSDTGEPSADFVRPSLQAHFLSEFALLKPTNIRELLRSGYSYYNIVEEKESDDLP